MGRNQKKIRELGHDKLISYGSAADYNKDSLSQIVANLINEKFIKRETGMYPTLSVVEKGFEFLNTINEGGTPELHMDEPEVEVEPVEIKMKTSSKTRLKSNLDYNQKLFEEFRNPCRPCWHRGEWSGLCRQNAYRTGPLSTQKHSPAS